MTIVLHDDGAVRALAVLFVLLKARNLGPALIFLTKSVAGWSKLMCCCRSAGREYAKDLVS